MAMRLTRMPGSGAGETRPEEGTATSLPGSAKPIGPWGYTGVAVTALGGPLALSALLGPLIAGGATSSAGLAMVAAALAYGLLCACLATVVVIIACVRTAGRRSGADAGSDPRYGDLKTT
jgi:hypothetical protein